MFIRSLDHTNQKFSKLNEKKKYAGHKRRDFTQRWVRVDLCNENCLLDKNDIDVSEHISIEQIVLMSTNQKPNWQHKL